MAAISNFQSFWIQGLDNSTNGGTDEKARYKQNTLGLVGLGRDMPGCCCVEVYILFTSLLIWQ